MIVVIAEKPSVARELARVLGANHNQDGYIEGNGYVFTWARGHLLGFCDPSEYDPRYSRWCIEDLPIIPATFRLKPLLKQNPDTKKNEVDEGLMKQLATIKKLFGQATTIINATDAGREGELIFRLIYEYCQVPPATPVQRLWISSQTEQSIRQGFATLQDSKHYDPLYDSARARAEADWIVGLNATRAISVASQQRFSMGRVQTPTLALICQRFIENKAFVPSDYYVIRLEVSTQNQETFSFFSDKTFASATEANALIEKLRASTALTIDEALSHERSEKPPLLYDLSALQQACNRRLGLTAKQTLEIAQSLYEKKAITYPRTSSRYIGQDVFDTLPAIFKNLASQLSFASAIHQLLAEPLSKGAVNDAKVTDHHALLPTPEKFVAQQFSEVETKVYALVVQRSIEAFHRPCLKEITSYHTTQAQEKFEAKGVVVRQWGWRSLPSENLQTNDDTSQENNEEQAQEQTPLPALKAHDSVALNKALMLTKTTKAKALLNDASLLALMETAGKDIDDEQIREAMKGTGIGTPATRDAIIEKLLSPTVGYCLRDKKTIIPTPKGLELYKLIGSHTIAQAALTGAWEYRLNEIAQGKFSAQKFRGDMETYAQEIVKDLAAIGGILQGTLQEITNQSLLACPKCKTGRIKQADKGHYCSDKACDFVVWKEYNGKKLSDATIRDLISKGRTVKLSFVSKQGKPYEAKLVLDEHKKTVLQFEKTKQGH